MFIMFIYYLKLITECYALLSRMAEKERGNFKHQGMGWDRSLKIQSGRLQLNKGTDF